jgi:hypothetical protein
MRRFPPILSLFVIALTMVPTGDAGAFDGSRRGFVLGLGAGWGQAEQTLSGALGDMSFEASSKYSGVATDFRIGGGLSEQWLLYWTSQQVFFSSGNTHFSQGIGAVGATWYSRPEAPALLLEGGVGVGGLADLEGGGSDTGFGILLGAGYEFARHWQLEATWFYAGVDASGRDEFGVDASLSTVRVTLCWMGY